MMRVINNPGKGCRTRRTFSEFQKTLLELTKALVKPEDTNRKNLSFGKNGLKAHVISRKRTIHEISSYIVGLM